MNLDPELDMPKKRPDRWSVPPVSLGNIDDALNRIAEQMPMVDKDLIYLWELETQQKIYILALVCGMMMFALAVMI